jgi:predicted nucleic acid-binding OB-fold protein
MNNTKPIQLEKIKIDALLYSRNNSTGKPTKYHIINEKNQKSFCGFDDFCSEVKHSENAENYFKIDFCQKCLNAFKKNEHIIRNN